jgi:hypothetical protein
LLQLAEATLDGVTLGGAGGVETGRASALGAAAGAVFPLISAFGDGVGHPPAAQLPTGRGVGVGLVGQEPDPAASLAVGSLLSPVVEQRNQLRVVSGLTSGQPQSHRPHPVVDQGMDLGGEAAPGPAQRVIVGLRPRNRVVRSRPLWRPQRSSDHPGRRRRAGGRGCWSSRPTSTSRSPHSALVADRNVPAQQGKSWRRCRPTTNGDAVSTPSATARTQPADPATAHQPGTATPPLPGSGGDLTTAAPAVPHPRAAPARSPPTTHR